MRLQRVSVNEQQKKERQQDQRMQEKKTKTSSANKPQQQKNFWLCADAGLSLELAEEDETRVNEKGICRWDDIDKRRTSTGSTS